MSATVRTSITEMMQTKSVDVVIEQLESYFPVCEEIEMLLDYLISRLTQHCIIQLEMIGWPSWSPK